MLGLKGLKTVANGDTVAHSAFLRQANRETFVADVSERNQEHFLCLGHKFSPHTNVAHMGKQGNNVCATMCTLMKCI